MTPAILVFSVQSSTHTYRVDVAADSIGSQAPRYIVTLSSPDGHEMAVPIESWDVVNLFANVAKSEKSYNDVLARMAMYAALATTKAGAFIALVLSFAGEPLVPKPPYTVAPSGSAQSPPPHDHCPLCGVCIPTGSACPYHGAKA